MGLLLLASDGLPAYLPWLCLTALGGLALFSTSLLAWQRPGVRFPLRGVVQGALFVAGAVLVARFVSVRLAGLLAVGLAATQTAFLWRKKDGAIEGLARASFHGATLRQRVATPALLLVIAFYANRLDKTGDFFLLFVLFFQVAVMRGEMAPVRTLGYLPLGRRARAARAVFLPLLALLGGVALQLVWSVGRIEWGHEEPKLQLTHVEGQRGLELRPSTMLWQLHLGSEAPLVTRPDGSTFRQELVPVVLGLSLRNPYEIGPGASEAFVQQRIAELGRALYGVELTPEQIERDLVQRSPEGRALHGSADGRFAAAFPALPRLDFRNRALGALALCVLLWALAVQAALVLPNWPLLSRRSLLVRMGASSLGARPARFLLASVAILLPLCVLTAFHDGLELASQVLLYQVGALLAQPAGALVALVLVGLHAARAIRRADRLDAVRLPLESAAA